MDNNDFVDTTPSNSELTFVGTKSKLTNNINKETGCAETSLAINYQKNQTTSSVASGQVVN